MLYHTILRHLLQLSISKMEQCIQTSLVYTLQKVMARRLQILLHQIVLIGSSHIV
nr:MAG TPA: hypothetical protein [Caudoviricetes sp.]DAT27296.1 MAG TPA: hypothetical protein [Caudoviricetes sp.]